MFSIAIFVIAMIGLLFTFSNCILLNESNNRLVLAANDAQNALEQVKGLDYANMTTFIANFNQSQFANLNNEQVAFTEADIGTRIANITVNVNWTERQRNRGFALSTHIAP
jgi:uncharacterized protein YjbI with pentapeptide repeats